MLFAFAFDVDEDVIEVYYHKNVKFFCQNLINIALKRGQCIDQSKKHHLVLEIAIAVSESCFLFIAFSDSHLMIDIGQIKLGKTSSST